jgi:predicted DCC family thiol-disulfide oxidoreductase YuxK
MGAMIVLFDADCGFCRWAMAWALRRDRRGLLVAVPIQSELGGELLADLSASERRSAAHVVEEDGRRRSAGAAAAAVLAALAPTRPLAGLARRSPRTTQVLYTAVAGQRARLGRLVSAGARRRADRLLQTSSVTTAAELAARRR